MAPATKKRCSHRHIQFDSSPLAEKADFQAATIQQLSQGATGTGGRVTADFERYASQFPAPLVLPDDELSLNPKYQAQPMKSWFNASYRNRITPAQHKIYVATTPTFKADCPDEVRSWVKPRPGSLPKKSKLAPSPDAEDVLGYMKAFFHGLPVLPLPDPLQWTEWLEICRCLRHCGHKGTLQFIGLESPGTNTLTRIRIRKRNDKHNSVYPGQLNLNDILDHMIAILPKDAYALLFLIDHDMYEDEEDDFCCGRAYGGSRVCVVSTAQYQPALDESHGIDIKDGHWWPGSHCRDFVEKTCVIREKRLAVRKRSGTESNVVPARTKRVRQTGNSLAEAIVLDSSFAEETHDEIDVFDSLLPLCEAMAAHTKRLAKLTMSEDVLRSINLRRVTLTASHELLHCFGFDHCVYRACAMQGTSCIAEDSRQPPYLCPVCESKLGRAILEFSERNIPAQQPQGEWCQSLRFQDWKRLRHEALASFCDVRGGSDSPGFCGLEAWTKALLRNQAHACEGFVRGL